MPGFLSSLYPALTGHFFCARSSHGGRLRRGEIAKRPSHFVGPSPSAGDADFLLSLNPLRLPLPPIHQCQPLPPIHQRLRSPLGFFPVHGPLAEGPPGQGAAPDTCLKHPPGARPPRRMPSKAGYCTRWYQLLERNLVNGFLRDGRDYLSQHQQYKGH